MHRGTFQSGAQSLESIEVHWLVVTYTIKPAMISKKKKSDQTVENLRLQELFLTTFG